MKDLTPCLWFDNEAEEAAKFYTGIFKDSKIHSVVRYPHAAENASGKPAGSVMTVEFEVNGQRFMALNGGPEFKFSEAVSFMVPCKDQKEIDYYWQRLTDGGEESVCGWLKDRYGFSWQVTPIQLEEMILDPDQAKVDRVMKALLQMRKLDLAELERAAEGAAV